ncbi:MAG TPA: tetratricopeptide repeat protein [Rhodocyclaceae bacterium]|nr:tetratricopeptide repeat protein [Rhodocyclaceae bacterium]
MVRLSSRLLALCIVASLAACGGAPSQADNPVLAQARDEHTDGQSAFARHDFDNARRHFERALRLHQSIDDGAGIALNRLDLARSRAALGDTAGADGDLDALLSSVAASPLRAEAARQKAVLALAANRLDDALRWQSEAAAQCGTGCSLTSSLALIRAQVALRRGVLDQAATECNVARAALPAVADAERPTPEHANVWRLGGEIALQRKDYAVASAHLEQALAADRGNGLPERVLIDLRLLAETSESAADNITARDYYRRLLDAALASQRDPNAPSEFTLRARAGLQRLDATLKKERP